MELKIIVFVVAVILISISQHCMTKMLEERIEELEKKLQQIKG